MKSDQNLYYDLIAACANPDSSRIDHNYIRQLATQITDWPELLRIAGVCRATPLLSDRLQASNTKSIPPDILQQLQRAVLINTLRNARLTQALADAMQALTDTGIPAITYKGPVLANEAYDNPSLRMYDDLDIMVQKKDLQKAKQILAKLGYRSISDLPENRAKAIAINYSNILQAASNTHNIDLTCQITTNHLAFNIPSRMLWQNIRNVDVDGYSLGTMSLEYLIIYLCTHGAKHLWFRPTWISDVAGMLAKSGAEIDWNKTINIAQKLDGLRMLLTGIKLAADIYGIAPPQQIAQLLDADPEVNNICTEIHRIIRISPGEFCTNKYSSNLLYLKMRAKMLSRLHCIILLATQPSRHELKTTRLPKALHPILYIGRPFRLLFKTVFRK